jgi:hypothetical protein
MQPCRKLTVIPIVGPDENGTPSGWASPLVR